MEQPVPSLCLENSFLYQKKIIILIQPNIIERMTQFIKKSTLFIPFVFLVFSLTFEPNCLADNSIKQDSLQNITVSETFPVVPFNYSLRFKDTESTLNVWRNGANDVFHIIKSPVRWKGKEWGIAAGIVAGGGLIYLIDEPLYESADFLQGNSTNNFSKYFLDPLGDYRYQAAALAGLYGISWITQNEKARNATILTAEGLLITGAITMFANFMTGRKMPNETHPADANIWMGVNHSSSFWSGHTATSFTIATVLSGIYNDKLWVPITSYTLATLVGMSRVVEGHHWTSDVFVGAAIGTMIGRMVVMNYKKRAVKFTPYYTGTFKGISAQYAF